MSPMHTVLVVDDETGILVLAQQLLEEASYSVYTAGDAEEALALLSTRSFDVLLTDIRLPDLDGLELIDRARQHQPEIAVVVMTGYKTADTIIRAVRVGIDGVLIKPNELGPDLVSIVNRSLADNHKKHPVIDLDLLPSLLSAAAFPLAGTTPAQAERQIARSIAEVLHADHAGLYQRSPSAKQLRLLSHVGSLPDSADEFWQEPGLPRAFSEEVAVCLAPDGPDALPSSVLERLGWSCALVASVSSPKNHYLFIAARKSAAPAFKPDHLVLLKLFARQAVTALENVRLWRGLTGLMQKMERAGGLLTGAARMAALDVLLPSALSEVNNPLQSLKSNLYLATRRDLSPERAANGLVLAQKEMYRLEGSVAHLLTLTQPFETERVPVDLEGAAGRVMEAFQPLFREQDIQPRLTAARPLPAVQAQRGALEQALTFVLLNAVEALTGASAEKIIYIDISNLPAGPVLAVEDTGPGVPSDQADQVFKPFFTTHPDHIGLGLAVSRQILERQGGRLALGKPAHGTGARFELHFPASG